MQTPQKNPPPTSRKSAKHHKPHDFNQRSVQSDNDAYLASPKAGHQSPSKQKQPKSRKNSAAQRRGGAQSDIGEGGDYTQHRPKTHSGSPRATPAKEPAYAGARFHESPAPSALPMPAFYSKSVPSNTVIGPISERSDTSPVPSHPDLNPPRETTPLDFLFDAARKAQQTPNGASPARFLSPPTGSPASRSPGPRADDGAFPFELDTPDTEIISDTNSTPFSARLNAARSPGRYPNGSAEITQAERMEKTMALKQALLRQSSDPNLLPSAQTNPFNARNINPNHQQPDWQSFDRNIPSGPFNGYADSQPARPASHSPAPLRNTATPANRPPSSGLRNAYNPHQGSESLPPEAFERRVSVGAPPPSRSSNLSSIYGSSPRPKTSDAKSHAQAPSLDDGLGDLKKMLNLSLTDRM